MVLMGSVCTKFTNKTFRNEIKFKKKNLKIRHEITIQIPGFVLTVDEYFIS